MPKIYPSPNRGRHKSTTPDSKVNLLFFNFRPQSLSVINLKMGRLSSFRPEGNPIRTQISNSSRLSSGAMTGLGDGLRTLPHPAQDFNSLYLLKSSKSG
jgi:hypothetical protein